MGQGKQADVLVVAEGDPARVRRCLEHVLGRSGSALRRLIVVQAAVPAAGGGDGDANALDDLAADPRVVLLREPGARGYAAACNLGLVERGGDVALLGGEAEVDDGWLGALREVAHSGCRTAGASPLTDERDDAIFSVHPGHTSPPTDRAAVRDACAGLPASTAVPTLTAACCLLRGEILDAVGLLDPALTCAHAAVADWSARAQTLGFVCRRANHVFVGQTSAARPRRREPARRGADTGSDSLLRQFLGSLDRPLPAHAVRLKTTGRLRVAYDLRPLPREQVGTRTYALSLATALAGLPDIDLTLLVRDPAQAAGLEGRVVTADAWTDDVQVIHRPMQVIDPRDLSLFYGSSAHLVVTYQDLIGYRIAQVFPTDAEFESYRATSCLSLQGVQRILAYSQAAAREIVEEFGIPEDEVAVVPLGVDAARFSARTPDDPAVLRGMRLPPRYFFSVATDFPHKNLAALLDAYALFRERWDAGRGAPPGLVLAGYPTGARGALYEQVAGASRGGPRMLGPVSADQLRVLYQNAEALVFPSLYEGFGLPPLEAMAAGTPVIAMPVSSVPEVGGDCVLYPETLSPEGLAAALGRLATDPALADRLRAGGLARVERFRWEATARATADVYRAAVLRPSERSLGMRRRLSESVLSWAESAVPGPGPHAGSHHPVVPAEPPGVRHAWKALNTALRRRLRREVRRLYPAAARKSA